MEKTTNYVRVYAGVILEGLLWAETFQLDFRAVQSIYLLNYLRPAGSELSPQTQKS